MNVRTRFAPSPTGRLHLGNVRAAAFNWLFTRHHDGVFILRIEDTDIERNVAGAEQGMLDDLRWLGLDWDEGPDIGGPHGPYRQSERAHVYADVIERLIVSGHAYPCFCVEQARPDPLQAYDYADEAYHDAEEEGHGARAASAALSSCRTHSVR